MNRQSAAESPSADNWTAPAGLALTSHRETQWTPTGIVAWIFAAACLGFGLAALWLSWPVGFDAETEGVITSYSRASSEAGVTASVEYRFENRGHTYTGGGEIDANVGGRLRVRFLRSNPRLNEPVLKKSSPAMLFGFIFGVVAIPLIYGLLRDRRLLMTGVPVRGVVTHVSIGGESGPLFNYGFRTPGGVEGTGRKPGSQRVGRKSASSTIPAIHAAMRFIR